MYFAIQDLKPIDPEINAVFAWIMGLMALILFLVLAFYATTHLIAFQSDRKQRKRETENSIWFDTKESVLHCGHYKRYIERRSYEYYVCGIVLAKPDEYHEDSDITFAKDPATDAKDRAVEQAVNRLNKKGIEELGLKNNLFKRDQLSTSVNDMYRPHIIN